MMSQFYTIQILPEIASCPDLPQKMSQAIRYVEDHWNKNWRPDELADAVSISRRQLERNFLRFLGVTPAYFLREVRLRKSKCLLQSSEMAVTEISSHCGFLCSSHFSRSYRDFFGETPTQTRHYYVTRQRERNHRDALSLNNANTGAEN